MASTTLPVDRADSMSRETHESLSGGELLRSILKPLASLRLTVVLLAMAIFLVLAGTLAQVEKDVWKVVHEIFRSYIAWIDVQVFFPRSFFPNLPRVPGTFPFPGGWLIGAAMAVNLFAAHAVRFTMQARGNRVWGGLVVLAVGIAATWMVIASGGMEGAILNWSLLWEFCKVILTVVAIAGLCGFAFIDRSRNLERYTLLGVSVLLATLSVAVWVAGDKMKLGDPSMRILWQLMQGGMAGVILLAGCWLLFEKRAGIVLLHGGIGLLMLSELMVGTSAIEGQMQIYEGGASNYVQDIRSVELAVIDANNPADTKVVAIPQPMLDSGARLLDHRWLPRWAVELLPVKLRKGIGCTGEYNVIQHPELPFDIRVVKYMQNTDPRTKELDQDNPATAGFGKEVVVMDEAPEVGGTSSDKQDHPAIYVELLERTQGEQADAKPRSLGTYLLSLVQSHWRDNRERTGLTANELRNLLILDRDFGIGDAIYCSRAADPVMIPVGDKKYELSLRFKRTYKPYTLALKDARADKYPGTDTPKNYSSDVRVVDPSRDVDREVHIWMNNPLRFAGETFYQQNFDTDRLTKIETTGIQIVTNTGWMIPYVSCMIVAVGMLFQFSSTLGRFVRRREAAISTHDWSTTPMGVTPANAGVLSKGAKRPVVAATVNSQETWFARWFPAIVVLLSALLVFAPARPKRESSDGYDLYAAGQIPVFADARAKPWDTLAKNTLQIMSNREKLYGQLPAETLKERWPAIEARIKKHWPQLESRNLSDYGSNPAKLQTLPATIVKATGVRREEAEDFVYRVTSEWQPAIRWMLDVASAKPIYVHHRVFRIENPEVLALFGLEARDRFLYSAAELAPQREKFNEEVQKARLKAEKKVESLGTFERKLIELDQRVNAFMKIQNAFSDPAPEVTPELRERLLANGEALDKELERNRARFVGPGRKVPLITPPIPVEGKESELEQRDWLPLSVSSLDNLVHSTIREDRKPDPAVKAWGAILSAYRNDKPEEFNKAVRSYRKLLAELPPHKDVSQRAIDYEVFFNNWDPSLYAWMLYIVGFLLAALAWLGWSRPMNRAAFWLTLFTFTLHTYYLISRIYISGRPPVTNLYSSAVFIGWACLALGLILEVLFRNGVGNIIATVAGFATLFISFKLAGDGDTVTVMQAVLDTQFWLATHVTSITIGYATTFLAGLLGLFYILCGVLTPRLTQPLAKDVSRMIYGTLCFAMFFSFVGTVLGGLWADDSWGRFWGWDPKENGALIIVLWNALILHARWAALVKERGMAVLAVVGNIVTSWSWFGVNELGIGLHSYGFTEGVLLSLGLFVMSQFAVIIVGSLPREMWRSPAGARPSEASA